jgi:CRP-like cAMP-binding protein
MICPLSAELALCRVALFRQASAASLAQIALIAKTRRYAAQDRIFGEGDPPDALYVVLSGRVRLHREAEEVDLRLRDDFFGISALFDQGPRMTSATALEESTLLRFELRALRRLPRALAELEHSVLRVTGSRLCQLAQIGLGSPRRGWDHTPRSSLP